MRKLPISIRLASCCIVALWTISTATYADFNLDKLKAIADRVQATQERMKQQDSKDLPAESSEGLADQGGEDLSKSTGAADGASIKAARANMDVVGVRVGMTLAEALKTLKLHNPKLIVKQRWIEKYADADNKEHTWMIFLYAGDKETGSEEFYLTVSLPPKSRVVSISRVRKYAKNEAPTMVSALDALRKKYGKENIVRQEETRNSGSVSEQFFWQVGGRVDKNRPCGGALRVRTGWNSDTRGYKDNTRCGLALSASVTSRGDNSALVYAVSAAVADYSMAYQDWQSSNDYLRNASRVRDKTEIEVAKKRPAPGF